MTYEEYNAAIKRNPYVEGGSSLHEVMHRASQEAMKITAELNGSYHSAEEVRHLLEKLWNVTVLKSLSEQTLRFCLLFIFWQIFRYEDISDFISTN